MPFLNNKVLAFYTLFVALIFACSLLFDARQSSTSETDLLSVEFSRKNFDYASNHVKKEPPKKYIELDYHQEEKEKEKDRVITQEPTPDQYHTWRCNGSPVPDHERKKNAVVSFLVSANSEYLRGVGVLGRSLVAHINHDLVGMYLLVLNDTALSPSQQFYLSRSGWKICRVPLIEPIQPEKVLPRFRQTFTKLALWSWVEFERVVHLDADTLVLGNISSLFECVPVESAGEQTNNACDFSASLDYENGGFQSGFNRGVLSIRPSLEIFEKHMKLAKSITDYRQIMGDQGMLNKVYETMPWHRLDLTFNANLAMYMQDRPLWSHHERNMRIIHYTMVKPFNLPVGNEPERSWSPIIPWFKQAETTALVVTSTGLYGKLMASSQLGALKQFWHSTPNVDIFFWTDEETVLDQFREDRSVVLFRHKKVGWPRDTYQRPSLYLERKDLLSSYTYIFSIDADLIPRKEVTGEINGDLVGLKHPGMTNSLPVDFTFERRPESAAYIPMGEGRRYYQGSIYGGRSEQVIALWTEVGRQIEIDLEKGIIARFHEESHLNHYFWKNPPTKEIGPSYSFPTGWQIEGESMVIEHIDKGGFGGHALFQT